MKKYFNYILFFVFAFFIFISNTYAREVKVYFFHGDGCPHCAEEEKALTKIKKKYPDLDIVRYEVWNNKDNAILMGKVGEEMEVDVSGVPLTIIGSSAFSGYSDSSYNTFLRAIKYYQDDDNSYTDVVSKIKNGTYKEKVSDDFSKEEEKTDSSSTIKLPLVGKVNMKSVSIPTAAVIIGFIDGFNPCAMWVLLFLISMLLGMKNRRRMWVLGISYYAFLV